MTAPISVHLTPTERYFRGEISLDEAAFAEVKEMAVERRETPFPAANFAIQLVMLVVALPVFLLSLVSPRRWFS